MTAEQMKYEFEVGYDRITNFDAPGYVPKEISTFLTRAQEEIAYTLFKSSENKEKNRKALSRLRQVIPLTTFTAGNYPNGFSTPLRVSVVGTGYQFVASGGADYIECTAPNNFITSGFRVGDKITVTGSPNNDGDFYVNEVTALRLTLSDDDTLANEGSDADTVIATNSILRVRNERGDVTLLTGHEFFDVVAGNALTDLEVDPVDDDFYHANKNNPFKKPSEKKLWRLDYADDNSKTHEYIVQPFSQPSTVYLHFDRKPRPIIVPETTAVPYVTADGEIDGIKFTDFDTGLDCLLDPIIHRDIVEKAVKLAFAALQDQTGFQISSVQEQQE